MKRKYIINKKISLKGYDVVEELLESIFASIWLPISLNILIKNKIGTIRRLICMVTGTFIMFVFGNISEEEPILILVFGCFCILLSVGMKCNKMQLLFVPIAYILIVLCNAVAAVSFETFANITSEQLNTMPWILDVDLCITILVAVFSFLLEKVIAASKYFFEKKYYKMILMLIGGNVVLCTIAFMVNNFTARTQGFPQELEMTNMLLFGVYAFLLLIVSVMVFKIFQKRQQMEEEKQQYKNIQEYSTQIERMYTNLREFKHDYVNILTALSGYLEEEDYEGLRMYFNEHILPSSEKLNKEDYRLNQLANIKDLALKGLISSKLIYAHEMQIDVFIDIMDVIEDINMNTIDLSRVMGIFLDNAIEAALETKEPEIKFNIVKHNGCVAIILMNNFVNYNIPIGKLEQENFSTKGENRGVGLFNVRKILAGYENVYKTTEISNGYFIQKLEIMEA